MLYARNIIQVEYDKKMLVEPHVTKEMSGNMQDGDVYIVKNFIDPEFLRGIKHYLAGIGKASLPNYHPIALNCPNSHRVNYGDERSYVNGCFHQFSFFPWNQDVFNFFDKFKEVYYLKNLLSGLEKNLFLAAEPYKDCISRLSFHCYPRGCGRLNTHSDPVDYHQISQPITLLSEKGVDFQQGGAYVLNSKQEKENLDDNVHW